MAPQRNMGVGSQIVIKKKPGGFGIIRESQGRQVWKIELVDDRGLPTQRYRERVSKGQIRRAKEGEFPQPDDESDNDSEDGEYELPTQRTRVEAMDHSSVETVLEDDDDLDGDVRREFLDDDDNPDDDMEVEDVPLFQDLEGGEDVAITPDDFAASRGIELDNDKHKAKWDQYVTEKEDLIENEWSVEVGPPKKWNMEVGRRVQEKRGQKRYGVVVGDYRAEHKLGGRPAWSVAFDGGSVSSPEDNLPSSDFTMIKDKRTFTWKTVRDHTAEHPVTPYVTNGVVGYNFERRFDPDKADVPEDDTSYDFPYLGLLEHLWPGNWRDNLRQLNASIEDENSEIKKHAAKRRKTLVSEQEWWIVWGIIFSACPCHKGGQALFEKESGRRGVGPRVDLSDNISFSRFRQIKERLLMAFVDTTNEEDPWHPVSALVKAFNDNRKKNIAAAIVIVLDESMSNFQPRTTKTSKLPHLSFVFRKPKPLGTEFKTAADTATGILLYIEIQRGAGAAMKHERFFCSGVGATACCSLRSLVASAYAGQNSEQRRQSERQQRRYLLLGDSWFGSVKMVEAVKLLHQIEISNDDGSPSYDYTINRAAGENPHAHEVIVAVKSNHAYFPKKQLEKQMDKWPGGSYIVMECTAPDTNVELVAIGYRYNARKTLCFLTTKNAGSTMPGATPYIARYPDRDGNICQRRIPRPEVLSIYFTNSNGIDVHNQLRQHILGLERYWKTPNPWLRVVTSIVGMAVVDAYRAVKYHCPHLRDMSVEEFANRLAHDCLRNPYSGKATATTRGFIPADSGNSVHSTGRPANMQSVLFHQVSEATDRLQGMLLSACGGGVNQDPSPLSSVGNASGGFFFGRPTAASLARQHDPIPIRKVDQHGRPVKRRCVICGENSRWECSDRRCMACYKDFDKAGELYRNYGTTICSLKCGIRVGHTAPCLVEHRAYQAEMDAAEHH